MSSAPASVILEKTAKGFRVDPIKGSAGEHRSQNSGQSLREELHNSLQRAQPLFVENRDLVAG